MNLNISGKTGLVTDAVEGIGRSVAEALAREGVRVVITGGHKQRLNELARELAQAGAPEPIVVVQDLMAADAARRISAAVISAVGWVDILVNNAAGSRPLGICASDEAWDEALTAHFTRHRQLTQRLLPCMIEHRWGRVVNITGRCDPEGINGASCAKAAMHAWAKALAREVAGHGVTVNCVAPGGDVLTVAREVCFLAASAAADVTGQVIRVDRDGPDAAASRSMAVLAG